MSICAVLLLLELQQDEERGGDVIEETDRSKSYATVLMGDKAGVLLLQHQMLTHHGSGAPNFRSASLSAGSQSPLLLLLLGLSR